MSNTIYASFPTPDLAERAAGALLDHGVREEDLSVVSSYTGAPTQNPGQTGVMEQVSGSSGNVDYSDREFSSETQRMNEAESNLSSFDDQMDRQRVDAAAGTYPTEGVIGSPTYTAASDTRADVDYDDRPVDASGDIEQSAKHGISTTTAGDAGAGAVKGAGWGLGIGAVAALASLLVPGVGIVVGGGALAIALGGLAAATGAGAAAGAVTGYLKDQGVDEHVAAEYDRTVQSGGAILAVSVPSGEVDRERVLELLDKYGASNVNAYEARATDAYMS